MTEPSHSQPKVMVDINELKGYEPPEHVKRVAKVQRMNSPYVIARIGAAGRVMAATVLALALVVSALILAGRAGAEPGGGYLPVPPYYCAGGGAQTPWGGFCDGATYPDGTHWHIANGMGIWMPMTCTWANGTIDPAPPSGCGRG